MTETIALSRSFLRIQTTRKLTKLLEATSAAARVSDRQPPSFSTHVGLGSSLVSKTPRVLGGNKQSSKLDDKSTGPADYKIKFEIRGAVGSEAVNREWLSVTVAVPHALHCEPALSGLIEDISTAEAEVTIAEKLNPS